MNLKEIMDRYTKESLLKSFMNLYPEQRASYAGYDYIMDELKFKEPVDTQIVLHIEMSMADGKDTYEVYGVDDENDRLNLSFLPWGAWLTMSIDDEILEYMDEKDIFSHALYELSFNGYSEDSVQIMAIELSEIVDQIIDNPDEWTSMNLEDLFANLGILNDQMMEEYNFTDLGTFEIESKEIILCDAVNPDEQIVIGDVKPGTWHASTVDYLKDISEDDPIDYIELTIRHEDIKDDDIYNLAYKREPITLDKVLMSSSNKIVMMDYSKHKDVKFNPEEMVEPTVIFGGAYTPCGKDLGPFTTYLYKDEEDKIIAVRTVLVHTEEDTTE